MRNALFTLLLGALALASPALRAADEEVPKAQQGPYVVIVGVAETADPTIQPRPSADADAKALFDLLSDKKYLDVKPERIQLLTSKVDDKRKGQKATRENILKAVHAAVTGTGRGDTVLIAYFGRGASAGDRTCFFAADTTFKERDKTGVLGTDLEADFKTAKVQNIALWMDINFKGFDAGKETIVEPTLKEIISSIFGGEDKGEQPIPRDRILMLSSFPANEPLLKGENSLFASVMMDGLKGAADTFGYEPDGVISMDELAKYAEKELAEGARKLGKTQKEKESEPFIIGEETSRFALSKNPAVTASVEKRLVALAGLEKANGVTKEIAAEGKSLLARMPKLKSQQELRKKYQALADGTLTTKDFDAAFAAIKQGMILSEDDGTKFVKKVMAAANIVEALYVKPTVKGDLVAAAIKGMYQRLEEPLPGEFAVGAEETKTWKKAKMEETLLSARLKLGQREDLEGHKDADLAITMLLASLKDPFTSYIDKETIKKSNSALNGRFGGVGIQFRRDLVRDTLLVTSPIKGSPAYKAGIQAGDLIVGIKRDTDPDGKPLKSEDPKEFDTKGMKTEQFQDIILGQPGVPITLVMERDGEKKEYTLKRAEVTVETVVGTKRDEKDNWGFWLDEKEKIGYIQLTQFTPDTTEDLLLALKSLTKAGMKGLVLDLRFNPGGALDASAAICTMFVDDGKVVSVRSRFAKEEVLRTADFRPDLKGARFTDFPIACLVNGQSASASEIVSACLQDYGRAVVIGERSYGKGSVQTVRKFDPTEGKIKLTFARYFPPGERNIDRFSTPGKPEDEWGVKPDKGYEVKMTREENLDLRIQQIEHEHIARKDGKGTKEEKKPAKDPQLEKAVEYLKGQFKTAKK